MRQLSTFPSNDDSQPMEAWSDLTQMSFGAAKLGMPALKDERQLERFFAGVQKIAVGLDRALEELIDDEVLTVKQDPYFFGAPRSHEMVKAASDRYLVAWRTKQEEAKLQRLGNVEGDIEVYGNCVIPAMVSQALSGGPGGDEELDDATKADNEFLRALLEQD
jgi:hypothetical protein